MRREVLEKKLMKKLKKVFSEGVSVAVEKDCIRVTGQLSNWGDIVKACRLCVVKNQNLHVVNDITLIGADKKPIHIPQMRVPREISKELEGREPDVLIIGGGISGVSIGRELSKWNLDILLVDKEPDLALHASGRNDGEVHPGVDLRRGSLKQHYVILGNGMYEQVCKELDVPFIRRGQYACFSQKYLYPLVVVYAWQRRHVCGVEGTKVIRKKRLREREPELSEEIEFALYNPSAGCVSPYELTIAYAENAVQNGAEVSLNTVVLDMKVKDDQIITVETNKGTLYPKLVINAAGTFAEDVAAMANDRFYSIHPRKGTNSILDKKVGHLVRSIASIKIISRNKTYSKGGGILRTVDNNLLVGPNAIETYEKENFSTEKSSIQEVFTKQRRASKGLSEKDIITYFAGVRAPTFEEDFIIEKGRRTKNLIHCAGIQSPGLTTAPAAALTIERMAVEELSKRMSVTKKNDFNPIRQGIPVLRNMSEARRTELIKANPDYGVIICRCEEISKGEIIDALNSSISVPTIDGIKKRIRPGMGRCQGGFCMPLISQIISEYKKIPLHEVKKSSTDSYITWGETKGGVL